MKSTPGIDSQFIPHPRAAEFVREQIDAAVATSRWLGSFQQRLLEETGTRLIDWVDHLHVVSSENTLEKLQSLGFLAESDGPAFAHPVAMFPRIVIEDSTTDSSTMLGIKVECVDDFIAANKAEISSSQISGAVNDKLRLANVTFEDSSLVQFVERHGYPGFVPDNQRETPASNHIEECLDAFRNRDRSYQGTQEAFLDATTKFARAADLIGKNRACDIFFRAEREYWQSRNKAAQIQHARQQSMGLGWANHDHHTYRCSRENFADLIHFLEGAGFRCRERFYAGKDAGWGAQVLEHPDCGIVIFADVDMSEDEVAGDFAHNGLEPKSELGTVGLWCKLHGDSFLAAGMHHLECQFDFEAARELFALAGVETMKPFTDFPHLKQAFTKGERWQVPRDRLSDLVAAGVISSEDAQRFEQEQVIGSHFEILERNDGYKGFNQTGVSQIILQTNPLNRD